MHQLMFVGMLKPQRRLADDFARRTNPKRTARGHPRADELLQVDAVDELHDQEMHAAGLARVVGLDDVRMAQPSDRLHLPPETADRLGIIEKPMGKDFQGNDLVEIDLPGLVDNAHAAMAQFLQQFVVAQATRFDGSPEYGLDQVGTLGESDAILFKLEKIAAPLAEIEFDFQQFPEQAISVAGGGFEQDLFNQGGLACLARLLELVACLVDAAG